MENRSLLINVICNCSDWFCKQAGQVCFLLWIGLFFVLTDAKAVYFHKLESANFLSQPSVMTISQDELGRMWFGTREGINVYDGREIIFYKGWVRGSRDRVWLGNDISYVCRGNDKNMYILSEENLYGYDVKGDFFRQLTFGGTTWTVVEDGGNVWFVQNDSIFRWDMQTDRRRYMRKSPVSKPTALRITKDYLFVGSRQGLFMCSYEGEDSKLYLKGLEIYSLFESRSEEMWIGTRMDGLYRLKDAEISRVPYSADGTQGTIDSQIREFVEDNDGNIWFGTFSGLQTYRISDKKYARIDVPMYVGGLNHPSIFSLFKDNNGVIWIGSYYGGVNYFDPRRNGIVHYDYQNYTGRPLYYSLIGNMVKDRDGNLWLSTDGGGISCLDKNWNLLEQFTAGNGSQSLLHNNIKDIVYDESRDCLFIGTYLGGLSRYDRQTHRFYNYLQHQPSQNSGDSPGAVIHHLKLWRGDLYISSREGIFRLDPDRNHFERINENRYCEWFDIDQDGTLYMMGSHSFTFFSLDDVSHRKTVWMDSNGGHGSLSQVLAYQGSLYVCMLGSGLYRFDKKTEQLHCLSEIYEDLPSSYCYAVEPIDSTRLLVLSDKGISLLSLPEKQVSTLTLGTYATGASVIDGCGLFSDGHQVYVGDTKGVTFFSLEEFELSRQLTPYFSSLWVNNLLVEPGDKSGILQQALPFTQELHLQAHQNNLTIYFQLKGSMYQHTDVVCEYKLEGFDKEWTPVTEQRIRYTRLRAGDYDLFIRPVGNPEAVQKMSIHIAAPFYATWWAILLYLLVTGSVVAYWIWNRQQKHAWALSLETEKRKQQALEFSLEKERMQARYTDEMNREKLVFFTNVSHELRTPLTLIVSYVDSLLEERLPDALYHKLQRIKQHSQIMTQLVTDLLDFRKFSQNKGKLVLSELDIVRFAYDIYTSFSYFAQHRSINYTFSGTSGSLVGWFDRQQLRKVLTNLLSNAFKYTPNGREISVKVAPWDDGVKITVSDTGIGIAPEDVPHIFDRFYQGKRQDVTEQMAGTGIGLALTKRLVELHHGRIYVESKLGAGSIFNVFLPLAREAYEGDEHIEWNDSGEAEKTVENHPLYEACLETEEGEEDVAKTERRYTVLLVEDNQEMRAVLKRIFQPHYHIRLASNGQEALEVVRTKLPDLVVSDVMMPVMNGTEFCAQVKKDPDLCHIPVILLTALNTPEKNIEGLSLGADDYITKPFNARVLLARADNLLRSRMLLRQQIGQKPMAEVDFSGISLYDRNFLQQVETVVKQHLADQDFDIPMLCREIGIGRSTLFSKFKILMEMTPNAFITNVRLQAAEAMFRSNPSLSVSEVVVRCGFSSVPYFRQCFKEKYGKSPLAYRKELGQNIASDEE